MRWLAAKTPELGQWGWGPISNGNAIDTFPEKMMDIVNDPTKILDEDFMMSMFSKYLDTLPPFRKYWDHLFEKKQMVVVASKSGTKVLQFAELRKELFHPSDPTNAPTDKRLVQLARVAAQGILDELHDQKKASWKYLSISGSHFSYQGCPLNVRNELLGRDAMNDRSESALGGTTHQLQQYGRIGITNAAAASDAKTNGYFCQFTCQSVRTEAKGMFHQFERRMHECLLTVANEDAPQTVSVNREELDNQREAKRKKEEMIEKKSLEKAEEALIEVSYYWDIYFRMSVGKANKVLSRQCWHGYNWSLQRWKL